MGNLEAVEREWGIDPRVEMTEVDNLADGKSGVVYSNKLAVGIIGQVSGEIMAGYELDLPVWILDLDFDLVKKLAKKTLSLNPAPKFSAISEDITLILPPKAMLGAIIETMKKKSALIQSIKVVDRWENTVTLRVEFNSEDKQLTQEEVNKQKEAILAALVLVFPGVSLPRQGDS